MTEMPIEDIISILTEQDQEAIVDFIKQKDQRIAELWEELEKYKNEFHHMCMVEEKLKNKIKVLKERGIE